MTKRKHAHQLDLIHYPSPDLITEIETATATAGTRVRVRVLWQHCGEPGMPRPYRIEISTYAPDSTPANHVQAVLRSVTDQLEHADHVRTQLETGTRTPAA